MLDKLNRVYEIKKEFKIIMDNIMEEEEMDLGANIAVLGAAIDLLLAAGQGNEGIDEKFVREQIVEYLKR